jgi:hypothetical protein
MAITIQKRPYDRNWSGNPMLYQLYSAAAFADATIFFEIAIWFKRRDEADYSSIVTFPFYPVSGTAKIDVHSIVHRLLEYELPNLTDGFTYENPLFAKKMSGFCYIKFREITTLDPDPAWATDADNARLVVKGGISYEKWRGENYWINYFDVNKPFLTWQQSGRLADLTERMYLPWLNLTDVTEGSVMMRRKLVFTDGTEDFAFIDFQVLKYDVGYFPAGATQLKLDEVDVTKTIWYWELQVYDVTDPDALVALSTAFKYELDNRNDYNDVTLNYRNSLGGLDSVRVRGIIEFSQDRSFTEQDRVVLADYWNDHFINPKRIAVDSTELLIYKGDVGHLGKEEQDRLRDIHHQREAWQYQQGKWMPMMLLTGNQRLKKSDDKLWGSPIEFAVASGGDNFYTPNSINLEESALAGDPLCDAIITTPEFEYIPGTGWKVTWALTSGTPVKYLVSTPGVSAGVPVEVLDPTTEYTFPWLPVGTNIITVRPVCEIGGEFYNGAAQTVEIVVASSCVPVAIDEANSDMGPFALTVGVPFSAEIKLLGTAPFTKGTSLLPDWAFASLVGDTLTISGTPDVITDPDLINIFKIKIQNCLFNNTIFYVAEYTVTV